MVTRWIGRRVKLKWMDGGEWRVVETITGWALCKPADPIAETLAGFTPTRVVWWCKRDLEEIREQGDTLL